VVKDNGYFVVSGFKPPGGGGGYFCAGGVTEEGLIKEKILGEN